MQRSYLPAITVMIALVLTAYVASGSNHSQVDKGRYIATRAAMCADCHTSRRDPGPRLTKEAPDLTSAGPLKEWSDEQITAFLMTGVTPSGGGVRPPMPRYRLDEGDATAVMTYLRSLNPAK